MFSLYPTTSLILSPKNLSDFVFYAFSAPYTNYNSSPPTFYTLSPEISKNPILTPIQKAWKIRNRFQLIFWKAEG
jgi:hypothetical protein